MNRRQPDDELAPQEGRAEVSQFEGSPHYVIADVSDLDAARLLIEDLENHGTPSVSIELVGADTKGSENPGRESEVAESAAFADLSKATIVGGTLGIVIGGLLGLLLAYLIPGLSWPWGVVIGGLFGAGSGGAAGGMSVAKYSSPAWEETFQVEDSAQLRVAVHHADQEIVEDAEATMARHDVGNVERSGSGTGVDSGSTD